VLPKQSGPWFGCMGAGMYHAGNCYRRQAVRRSRGGAVDQNDFTHAARAQVLDIKFTNR